MDDTPEKEETRKTRHVVEKVVVSEVTVKKQSLARRIRQNLFGENFRSIGQFLAQDVIFPAVKDLAYDSVTSGVERAIFGEVRSRGRSRSYRPGGYTPYNRYATSSTTYRDSRDRDRDRDRRDERREIPRGRRDPNEIVIANRHEAEGVLDELVRMIDEYDIASVADLYSLVGITGAFTDDKWGWNNLDRAKVVRTRDGFVLDLPRPIPID